MAEDETSLEIVAAGPGDRDVLWLMLTYAASMGAGGQDQVAVAQADSFLRAYVEGWGRPGDLGLVARDPSGGAVGAAWLRLVAADKAAEVDDPEVPELALGVLPEWRGRGVGTHLMERLIEAAQPLYKAIVLSVRQENPAVRLYRRLGFGETGQHTNRVGGTSLIMRLEL